MASSAAFRMQESIPPSRPFRLGTHRRRAKARGLAAEGAARSREARAGSLDTRKDLLETSVANWLKSQETEQDRYDLREALWRRTVAVVHGIYMDFVQELLSTPKDGAEWRWWAAYEAEKEAVKADLSLGYDAWLEAYAKKRGVPTCKEEFLRWKYLDAWKRKNRPGGICKKVLDWERQYHQLFNCQSQWIGKRAACCGEKTPLIAVPIGCNHRLCPLCNWRRTQNAQKHVKRVFDRIEHPWFLTLTVPNVPRISKHTFHFLRERVKQFLAARKDIFQGGVYAIETTYNQGEKSWHVHAHVMVDCAFALPTSDWKFEFAGRTIRAFDFVKLALEYDWSRLWCKSLSKPCRKNASKNVLEGERFEFEQWVRGCWRNSLKTRVAGRMVDMDWLPAEEIERRHAWNKANRRVMWIVPVTDRDKAVKEVLKYITKSADFIHIPEAVIEFFDASRSTRLLQTFGSWYGIDWSISFDTAHMDEDFEKPHCACGLDEWQRIGVFTRRDVRMGIDGHWYLKGHFNHNARGTVPRPTIRALEVPEPERTGDR